MDQESSTATATSALTDEMPANPEEFASWAEKVSMKDEGTAGQELALDASATSGADSKEVEAKVEGKVEDAQAVADSAKTEDAQGVLTKDGKSVIPYTVLAETRKAEAAAREAAAQAHARAQQLEEELKALREGKQAEATSKEETDSLIQQIEEQIGESVPEIAAPLKAMVERLQKQEAEIAKLRDQRGEDDARGQRSEQERAAEAVQEAIDANPKLLYLQRENPELWEEAVRQDKAIRENARFSGLSLGERFSKAVAAVEAIHGAINVPSKYLPPESREIQARAEVKTEAKPKPAITLSDLPGGTPPVRDDRRLEEMSPRETEELVNRLIEKGMSPQELAQHLGAEYGIG